MSRGTSSYRAPELLRSLPAGFNSKTDIWSLGCIGYELLTGQKAFIDDIEVFQYFTGEKTPKQYFKRLDQFSKLYIHDLLEPNPENRPSAKELLDTKFKNDWPQEVNDEEGNGQRDLPSLLQIASTSHTVNEAADNIRLEKRTKFLQWLSADDYTTRHEDLERRIQEDGLSNLRTS
jgi:serine/threonine protein kinase